MKLPEGTIIAAGPVIIEDGKVLLNRERKSDGEESPYFMFPGGTVDDFSIPFEETAIREAKEEMGIDIEIIRPLRTLITKRPGKETYAILVNFLAKRTSDIIPGPDTLEWGWYDIEHLPENCAPNIYEIVSDIKNEV